ncbi:hypothetical protein BB934_02515 [Microvirga ossetica]|uniref:Uncharacterized protein n=1 Tax=Microvirga ossetica TaxID=1882682 RepID=A0A1B2EB73_9HYPH|nr:hypothetical protein BB934_02515 [Microvirga ossetica]
MGVEAAAARAMEAGKAPGVAKVVPMETAAEKAAMAGRATLEEQAAGTGMPEAARAARLEATKLGAIRAEAMQAQAAQARATKAESAVTVKAGAKATLAGAVQAAAPPEVQAVVPEEAPALGRVPVTAAPEATPRARAKEATRMAIRPQAPVTESQATTGTARDEAAKGQARLTTHGAGTGVPEIAREPARPKRDPAWGTVKATAPPKGTRKAVLAVSVAASARVRAAAMLKAAAAKPEAKAIVRAGTAARGRVNAAA